MNVSPYLGPADEPPQPKEPFEYGRHSGGPAPLNPDGSDPWIVGVR